VEQLNQVRIIIGTDMDIVALINKYGFPIVAAGGMGYFVYYVWTWVTTEIKPVTSEANNVLIALIDRIRMLDNDLIRLNQKVNVILSLRKQEKEKHDDKTKISNSTDTDKSE
jgi:hypothetical protein